MDNLIGMALFDILKDSIPFERRVSMYASMSLMQHLRNGYTEEIALVYNDEYPELVSEIESGKLDQHSLELNYTREVPNTLYTIDDTTQSVTYYNKALNGPIKRVVESLKELNGFLDDYLKKEQLTEAERAYVMIIKQAMARRQNVGLHYSIDLINA